MLVGVKLGYLGDEQGLNLLGSERLESSLYISSYVDLNPSKSPFCIGPSPRNAVFVWGALIAGE